MHEKGLYAAPESQSNLSFSLWALTLISFAFLVVYWVINTIVTIHVFLVLIKVGNPWWQVTLEKTLYVESVEITDKIDCCPRDIGMIKVAVSTNQTGDPSCTKSLKYGNTQKYKVHCSPPALGRYVTVTLTGDNVTLVLCYVLVRTFGKLHRMYLLRVACKTKF